MQRMSSLVVAAVFAIAACGGNEKPPESPASPPAAEPAEPSQPAGTGMTADQCTAAGGEVVGDIGDGAIHRPDYRCAKSGEPPLGPIQPEAGQPVAIEGAVCCK